MHTGLLKLQTVFLGIIALMAVGYLLQLTAAFMIPFVIACLLVVILAPAQDWLEARGLPTAVAIVLLLLSLFTVFVLIGILIYDAILSVSAGIHRHYDRARELLEGLDAQVNEALNISVMDKLASTSEGSLVDLFSSTSAIQTINSSVGSFMSFFSALILMLLFLMFILGSRHQMNEKLLHFLKDREFDAESSEKIVGSITRQVRDYLVLKTVISLGTGLVTWLVAYLCGLDFAVVWGFLAFVLNFIPSIGPIIAFVPPVAIAFLQFESLGWAAAVSSMLIVVQFASGNIIEPKVMGDRLNLNIVVVLMSLFVWGLVWGFAGMVLSVPLTASINIILANTERFKSVSVWLSN